MKKIIFSSFILSLPTSLFTIIKLLYIETLIDNKAYNLIISLGTLLIPFALFLFFIRQYKLQSPKNDFSFGNAFKYGIKISVGWAIFVAIIMSLFVGLNKRKIGEISSKSKAIAIEKIVDNNGSASAGQKKRIEQMLAYQNNPWFLSGINFVLILFWGTVYSLIAGAIFKSKVTG